MSEAVTDAEAIAPYPAIRKACLEIAYDNGGVNRYRPESQVKKEIDSFLSSRPYSDQFAAIDAWLADVTDEEFETVCAGDEVERDAVMRAAPPFTETLLDEYFQEVC